MDISKHSEKRILVVDDDRAIRRIASRILGEHFQLSELSDGIDLFERFMEFRPDIVLLDIEMPGPDGFSLCRRLKTIPAAQQAQVIIISGRDTTNDLRLAYEQGADDYLLKPVSAAVLLARVQLHCNLLDARKAANSFSNELAETDSLVAEMMANRRDEQRSIQDASIFLLAKVAETRDTDTGNHLMRISQYCTVLAAALVDHADKHYRITYEESLAIGRLSILHDIGKVGIPDAVLLKPGKLTAEEWICMKRHTEIGAQILGEAVRHFPLTHFLRCGAVIAKYHHERWDGTGYPTGLAGHAIPLPARIVAVADVFDALTSDRPYRTAWTADQARDEIINGRGSHFDPVIADVFLDHYEEFCRIQKAFAEPCVSGKSFFPTFQEPLLASCLTPALH